MSREDDIRTIVASALGVEDRGSVVADRRRNSQWSKKSRAWLKRHNHCAVCGSAENLEVHHIKPYHLFPELEMEPTNWIALCRSPHDCHRLWGHLGDFRLFNPIIDECVSIAGKLVGAAKAMAKLARS